MNQAFCQANVFVAIKVSQDRANVRRILKRFGISAESLAHNSSARFEIFGQELETIQSELIIPLVNFLDPDKRSSFLYRSFDGQISTILIQDGKLNCA